MHKSRFERFADDYRATRYAGDRFAHTKTAKSYRRAVSMVHGKLFQNVVNDKRFSVPILFHTLTEYCGVNAVQQFMHTIRHYAPDGHTRFPFNADWGVTLSDYDLTVAHPALKDAVKIACYPTRADAARGREVVMTAGRYFTQTRPGATPADIQQLAEAYAERHAPVTLQYAVTGDEWASVYANGHGFSSCMRGWCADDPYHPVRFYAREGNGLALAYITDSDKRPVARAVVNRERMAYVKVYGDNRLTLALEAAGYKRDGRRALEGVECNAIEHPNGGIVAPWIDAVGFIDWDGGDVCIITADGDIDCENTDGIANGYSMRCDDCGDGMHEDDSHYSEFHDVTICQRCADHNYTYAIVGYGRGYASGQRFEQRDLVRDDEVVEVNREYYAEDYDLLADAGFVQDRHGDWQDMDDCIFLEYLGEHVVMDDYRITQLDIPNSDGDEYMLDEDTIKVTIAGEEKIVAYDYDGMTDSDRKAIARSARRMVQARGYSRAPQRGNGRSIRGRKRAKLFARMVGGR